MALSARLIKGCVPQLPCAPIPECVITYFGDDFAVTGDASVSATIGIFTITQLERNVQIMIPSYDFVFLARNVSLKATTRAKYSAG